MPLLCRPGSAIKRAVSGWGTGERESTTNVVITRAPPAGGVAQAAFVVRAICLSEVMGFALEISFSPAPTVYWGPQKEKTQRVAETLF